MAKVFVRHQRSRGSSGTKSVPTPTCRPLVGKTVRGIAATKWTRAYDRRFARLFSCIHHTSDYRQFCHAGNTAQHCRLCLLEDPDFAGDLEDSKSTSGRVLCIFGSRTFAPTSWMCAKQTSVSHSSTESEILPLDAGLRMDGIPALDLWDAVKEALHYYKNVPASGNRSRVETNVPASGNRSRDEIQSNLTNPKHQDEDTR